MTATDLCNLALAKIAEKRINSIDDPNDESARSCKLVYASALNQILRSAFWNFAQVSVRIDAETALITYPRRLIGASIPGVSGDLIYVNSPVMSGPPKWRLTGETGDDDYSITGATDSGSVRWTIKHDGDVVYTATELADLPEDVGSWTPSNGAAGTPVVISSLTDQISGYSHAFEKPSTCVKIRQLVNTATGNKIDKFRECRANGKIVLAANANQIILTFTTSDIEVDDMDPSFQEAFTTLIASKVARRLTGSDELRGSLVQQYENLDLPNARQMCGQDTESGENHPLEQILAGDLIYRRPISIFDPAAPRR